MSVIRGKIFTDREVAPDEVTIGGEWPFDKAASGAWVIKGTNKLVKVLTLEEVLASLTSPPTTPAPVEEAG